MYDSNKPTSPNREDHIQFFVPQDKKSVKWEYVINSTNPDGDFGYAYTKGVIRQDHFLPDLNILRDIFEYPIVGQELSSATEAQIQISGMKKYPRLA